MVDIKFQVPSKDEVGYHSRVEDKYLSRQGLTADEYNKVRCDGCQGVPISPAQCLVCKQIFCAEYLIPQLNYKRKCPKMWREQ